MSNTCLLIQPIPYPDESADSFLLRATLLNKHSSTYNLFGYDRFKLLEKHAPNCDLTELPRFKYALQALNLDPQYKSLAFERASPTSRSVRTWGNLEIDHKLFKKSPRSYCPKCLAEQPFFRKLWLLTPIYACPKHSIYLVDHCYQCGQSISLHSGEISTCSNCRSLLKDAPAVYCSSKSNLQWFLEILNQDSNEFFQKFTSYWLAISHFTQLVQDSNLTTEEILEMTREYFIDQQSSITRLSKWINTRIHLAHPRIQLLPFLKNLTMFHHYIKLIEEKCYHYTPTPHTKNINLKPSETRLVLGICQNTLKNWIAKGLVPNGSINSRYKTFSSILIEQILTPQCPTNKYQLCTPPASPSVSLLDLGLNVVAKTLNVNYETARKPAKTHWLNSNEPLTKSKTFNRVSPLKLKEFHSEFILASTLAKEINVNPTNLVEKLISIGINPISGPHIDGTPFNIFSRSSVLNICKVEIESIKEYPTRAGRHKNTEKSLYIVTTSISLREAADQLGISANKVAVLVQRGILTKDETNPFIVIINEESLLSLKHKISGTDFVTTKEAALLLNCSLSWLGKYWCLTGFLEIHDLMYWKLIKRSELNKVLGVKKDYLTGVEASTLLNMPHSYITNLQKQGIIRPLYVGNDRNKIRLFKRVDVLRLRDIELEKRNSTNNSFSSRPVHS